MNDLLSKETGWSEKKVPCQSFVRALLYFYHASFNRGHIYFTEQEILMSLFLPLYQIVLST